MTGFILSLILGGVALLLTCMSYFTNDKRRFFAVQILANLFYASSFLVQGVFVGGINTIISIVRVFTLFFFEKSEKNCPVSVFLIFSTAYLIAGNLCLQSEIDILAVVAYELFNMAMFVSDMDATRILMILPNIIIATYNLLSSTFTNAALDMIEVLVLFLIVIKSFSHKNITKFKYLV